jgi:hypothetical protein
MDVCLSPVLLLHVPMRDVHVLQCRMIVLVSVSGEQVPPILSSVQVVRDVIVLVAMLQGLMLVMSLLPGHSRSPLPECHSTRQIDRTWTHAACTKGNGLGRPTSMSFSGGDGCGPASRAAVRVTRFLSWAQGDP